MRNKNYQSQLYNRSILPKRRRRRCQFYKVPVEKVKLTAYAFSMFETLENNLKIMDPDNWKSESSIPYEQSDSGTSSCNSSSKTNKQVVEGNTEPAVK